MVEIDQVSQVGESRKSNGKQQADSEVDYELIRQVRETIKDEFENHNEEEYSRVHFDELMDDNAPLICWRYIIHCGKKIDEAIELIKLALIWRKENGIDELKNSELVKEFWLQAPISYCGVSKDGRDVVYVIGKNYRKPGAMFKNSVRKFCLNLLFSWEKRHLNDMKTYIIVFDVTDTGIRNIDLDFMSWLISIRDYIPTRISTVYVVGIPFLVRPLIRLIISWLPEKFSKIVYCGTKEELVEANIEKDQLPFEVGGPKEEFNRLAPIDAPWTADSPVYSDPGMLKVIEETFGFSIDEERKIKLREMQIDFENNTLNDTQLSR